MEHIVHPCANYGKEYAHEAMEMNVNSTVIQFHWCRKGLKDQKADAIAL